MTFQMIIFQREIGRDWQAVAALPSLHPGAAVQGAILWQASAIRISDKADVQAKAIGTGERFPD